MPADRIESLGHELAPVFEHLEPALRECGQIAQEATEAAQRLEAEAAGRAHDIVARARTESEAERANGWTDAFLTGHAFGSFLDEESARVRELLARLGMEPGKEQVTP